MEQTNGGSPAAAPKPEILIQYDPATKQVNLKSNIQDRVTVFNLLTSALGIVFREGPQKEASKVKSLDELGVRQRLRLK